jgi:hypothetical protein
MVEAAVELATDWARPCEHEETVGAIYKIVRDIELDDPDDPPKKKQLRKALEEIAKIAEG